MHHQDKPLDPEVVEMLRSQLGEPKSVKEIVDERLAEQAHQMKLGATGQFPGGKLTPDDEGQIQFAVGELEGKVVINFGKPVVSIGMSPIEARQLAKSLHAHAREIQRR